MILTIEQIKTITVGAAEIFEDGEYTGFHRFTAAQRECYKELRGGSFYKKTLSTAGVRLAFTSDSDTLAFDYKIGACGSSRQYAYIDVTVDGVLRGHFGAEEAEGLTAHAELSLTGYTIGKTKLVEIYLPWSREALLANLALDDSAAFTPARRARMMINYGDSITHGYDAKFPSMSYASRLARMVDADAYNRAIGGDTFFPELLEPEECCTPDIVTAAYGTNDWSKHNAVQYAKGCGEFYRKVADKFPTAKIFAITPIWRGDYEKETPFGAPAYETEAVIRRCTKNLANVVVIPGWNLVPHHEGFMHDKRLHPNDLGFAEYARNLYDQMQKYL